MPWIFLGAGAVLLYLLSRNQDGASMDFSSFTSNVVTTAKKELAAAILPSAAQQYIEMTWQIGEDQGVDPMLLLAIMQRESSFGLTLSPPGSGGTGDGGHGRGLMQIDDRSWGDWLSINPWGDPSVNITKGAQILAANFRFFATKATVPGISDGSTVTITPAQAARRGVMSGAYGDPRPLYGSDLAMAAVAAYNTGAGNVLISLAAGRAPDSTTANGDYASAVVEQVALWSARLGG